MEKFTRYNLDESVGDGELLMCIGSSRNWLTRWWCDDGTFIAMKDADGMKIVNRYESKYHIWPPHATKELSYYAT